MARPGGRFTGPIVGPVVISRKETWPREVIASRRLGGWLVARFFSEIDRKRSGSIYALRRVAARFDRSWSVAPPLKERKNGNLNEPCHAKLSRILIGGEDKGESRTKS